MATIKNNYGEGGPQYLALTSWNDATDPEQGANNYTVYRHERPGQDDEGKEKPLPPFFQPHGDPLTSKDADGQGNSGNRADDTGNGIDITWFLRYLGIKRGPGKKFKSGSEKSKELKWPVKTISEIADNETKGEKTENEETKEEVDMEKEKRMNTRVRYQVIDPAGGAEWGARESPTITELLTWVDYHPKNYRFKIIELNPNDPQKAIYTISEIQEIIKTAQAND